MISPTFSKKLASFEKKVETGILGFFRTILHKTTVKKGEQIIQQDEALHNGGEMRLCGGGKMM